MTPFAFGLQATDGAARAGMFTTPHGTIDTPAFLPVGTLGTVKTLDPEDLTRSGVQMVLANAYHLHLRPGDEVVRDLGGLHRFMGWPGPILTDSGGFQVFSLEGLRRVDEDGVAFRSHLDGSLRRFTPESVMGIQRHLGADVIMPFDHVIPGQADFAAAKDASDRSIRWLARSMAELSRLGAESPTRPAAEPPRPQALFPIVQGGIHAALRRDAMRAIGAMGDWAGVAVGGLSVGEAKPDMYAMLEALEPELPRDRPRYLMGVGFPQDLIAGVARGIDLFDCVAPTRMGRNGTAFTGNGRVNVKRADLRADGGPLDPGCACTVCARFSRGYLRHLYVSDEILGLRLLSLHNVHFLVSLMRGARQAIEASAFDGWAREWQQRLAAGPEPTT
jgi:queuine tRNA-ribosyltransferase